MIKCTDKTILQKTTIVLAVLLLGTGIAEALVDPCENILDYIDYYDFVCYNASIGQAIWCSIIVGSVFDLI